ncbi:PIKK family atypical protein kinase [Tritrichomonas foetus]|uniref:PIKK family atypical protein kinase n=1 Tax=Tritrichomonas foetus TaxID=1144522 RepID=A0A1J4K1D5_9EUKA|nr:PIKK family atypical protein kinase [Tritrichomonas foetus]|eukprot:OHT04600.1 PIKK family atypical protein kinase [Tritrichomonas foetus]
MFDNDSLNKIVSELIDVAVPPNQSLKEDDFDFYVEDLQDQIINYFNYHKLAEVPQFLEKLVNYSAIFSKTDDKKRRYSAAVCLATIITLFPFDDYIPQFEPIVDQLLRPGFKRLVMVGAMVVGRIGYLSGPNRDHFIHVLVEDCAKTLSTSGKPESLFVASIVLKELAASAPEHIFNLGSSFHNTISAGLQSRDSNVRDICIEIVEILFQSQSASVGLFFLTDFLDLMRKAAAKKLADSQNADEIVANLKLLQILLKQRPFMTPALAGDLLFPVCAQRITSPNFEIMMYSIDTILFLHKSGTITTEPSLIKTMVDQLFLLAPKQPKGIERLFSSIISHYPDFIRTNLTDLIDGFNLLLKIPKNAGPPVVFKLAVETIKIVQNSEQLQSLFQIINTILDLSTVPTPIHILIQALNESKPDWNVTLRRYKQYLIRMIHELLSEPSLRWEAVVISFNALDQIHNISYSDAVMLHSLVMSVRFVENPDWQIRERVATTAIHVFHNNVDRMPLESMKRLVDLCVDDPVRSVRKKTLFSFTKEVYRFLAQPEIINKFAQLVHDESFVIRKHSIEILGELVEVTSGSILREMLLTTLRQLPDKYNPIIPPRICDNFPHLIWASQNFIHLYASAIFQRFIKMLDDRFNKATYKDPAIVYMNSAQLYNIDGSIIKALSRINELCPKDAPSGPIIQVLSHILMQPVHPWTKTHALKALKNIAQGEEEVGYIMKQYPILVQCLFKLIRQNTSIKLVTKSLKVLGAVGLNEIPPVISKKKDIFIFRSFFTGSHQFRRYFIRIIFTDLFELFEEPMVDGKKKTIAQVVTDLFVADPESVATYISSWFAVFLPSFTKVSNKTLKSFLSYLTTVISLAGRLIVPHATTVFSAIEGLWRQQFTVEGSRVISALVEAAYGQCDSILHLVVPIIFQLLKFKGQSSAYELFHLLQIVSDYTPSYLSIIVQGLSDIAGSAETPDASIGYCVETLHFIVKKCDCVEHLPTIKRCVIKLKNHAGVKYKEAAARLLRLITERKNMEDDIEDDFDEKRAAAPEAPPSDSSLLLDLLKLPKERNDASLGAWYKTFETALIRNAPSLVIRALLPLNEYPGLLPKFSFVFAYLVTWININSVLKGQFADLLDLVFKCNELPSWVAEQFLDLVEFSFLSDIDLRIDVANVIQFCESKHYYAKALLFIENSPSIYPIQKTIALNSAVGRKLEARSLAFQHNVSMEYKQWMELEEWEIALKQIRKSVDPSRYIFHQVVCMAALEDWDGILALKDSFYDLSYYDRVQIARYFMTAEMWNGNVDEAQEFLNATNGFSVEDQIMRATALIKLGETSKAHAAVHIGWRYLAASVSAVEKCNKNQIQTQLFQAHELLELSEVLMCLNRPEFIDSTNKVWRARLRAIEYEPNKQKELFKIRALVPNLPHFDAHMLDIISYYIWLGKKAVARRLSEVFFPDENSFHAKYVELELSGREEKIDEMLSLAHECNCPELASRLQQLVGNIKLKRCNTTEGLQQIAQHYVAADKSQEKIANINILLAHTTKDPSYAAIAATALGKCMKTKIIKTNLFAHMLLGLVINFSDDESTGKAVKESFSLCPINVFPDIMSLSFSLLLHSKATVRAVALQICLSLVSNYPQYCGFQLLAMEECYSDSEEFGELYDKTQMESPVVFAQVSLIATQLKKISTPFNKLLAIAIQEAKELVKKGNQQEALKVIRSFLASSAMNEANLSLLNRNMKHQNEKAIREYWQVLQTKQTIGENDFEPFELLISRMNQKYESMRVLKLSSVSEMLEKKSAWKLFVLGKQSLQPDGARISKFFHCVGNLDNGYQITIIGSDGKRYNYIMRGSTKEKPLAIQQFINLIRSLVTDVHSFTQGAIFQLADELHLYEVPKNQISMYEMITVYQQSKQRIVDAEQVALRAWKYAPYNELELDQRVEVLKKLRKQFDGTDLAHAMLVTSKDADSWAHKTSLFSFSLGALSAVAYIIGTVNQSPQQILIDKTTGAVTFSRFSGMEPKQAVPFRLTPMIENALGRYGVSGPFSKSFSLCLKEISRRARAFAPFLQFTTENKPFEKPVVPNNFLSTFGINVESRDPNELDGLYTRIASPTENSTIEQALAELVKNAKSVKNIALMPMEWYPWW